MNADSVRKHAVRAQATLQAGALCYVTKAFDDHGVKYPDVDMFGMEISMYYAIALLVFLYGVQFSTGRMLPV